MNTNRIQALKTSNFQLTGIPRRERNPTHSLLALLTHLYWGWRAIPCLVPQNPLLSLSFKSTFSTSIFKLPSAWWAVINACTKLASPSPFTLLPQLCLHSWGWSAIPLPSFTQQNKKQKQISGTCKTVEERTCCCTSSSALRKAISSASWRTCAFQWLEIQCPHPAYKVVHNCKEFTKLSTLQGI